MRSFLSSNVMLNNAELIFCWNLNIIRTFDSKHMSSIELRLDEMLVIKFMINISICVCVCIFMIWRMKSLQWIKCFTIYSHDFCNSCSYYFIFHFCFPYFLSCMNYFNVESILRSQLKYIIQHQHNSHTFFII